MDSADFLSPGRSIPPNVHVVDRLRDVVILDLPSLATTPPTYTRTAIILDKRADPRMFEILFALHYQNLNIRVNLLAIAKVEGMLRWWYGDPDTFMAARAPLIKACNSAFWPTDRIYTENGILVPMKDGRLDRDNLPSDETLLRTVPERYKLGLVQP
jgi:hypothetical protein